MPQPGDDLTADRRAMLSDKGRRLYGKFCGTGGRGICAESFAVFHIGRGEAVVAEDLIAYLDGVVDELQAADPDGRLTAARGLVARIRRHLGEAADPALRQTGGALRAFVLGNSLGPDGE